MKIFGKKSHKAEKGEKLHSAEKCGTGTLLLWNGFVFDVRGFGCVQNQVLSTYGKSAQVPLHKSETDKKEKKLVTVIVRRFSSMEKRRLKTVRSCRFDKQL